jgi:hypothetical protein
MVHGQVVPVQMQLTSPAPGRVGGPGVPPARLAFPPSRHHRMLRGP